MTRRGEFDLIHDLFAPLARRHPAALGLTDDAAVMPPPADGSHLVISVDTLVIGVHIRPEDPPESVARKALRVNLSDMAAMGATPTGLVLSAALSPALDDAWLEGFAAGLDADLSTWSLGLLGGDTVSTPGPASFSVTMLGTVPPGAHLTRSGGSPGEDLWVSGTIGDSALGLGVLTGDGPAPADPAHAAALARRYQVPEPRVALGQALRGLATAALDVSDGLVADLGHLARASGCAARLEAAAVPLSAAARATVGTDPAHLARVLTGGDDYELLFAAPRGQAAAVQAAAAGAGVAVTRIGRLDSGAVGTVAVVGSDGAPLTLARAGWVHRW